jgi:aromatic-L-amino-acid/L-tryptophan decarboxylase
MSEANKSFIYGCAVGSLGSLCIVYSVLSFRKWSVLSSSDENDADNSAGFKYAGKQILDWIVDYRENLVKDMPAISKVEPNYLAKLIPKTAPTKSESWSAILADLNTIILPGLTNWQSRSKFFAYFKTHASYPGVLGELLCAGLNVVGFDWIASPVCTELEVNTLDWLAEFLNLPSKFYNLHDGPGTMFLCVLCSFFFTFNLICFFVWMYDLTGGSVIQGTSGESAIVIFLAAIIRKQKETSVGTSRDNLVVFYSDQAHAIMTKACMVLGIQHRRILPAYKANNFALQPEDLRKAIREEVALGRVPISVVATSGTTSSLAFDNLQALGEVCREEGNLWFHVDAAYAGAFACLPEHQHLFKGLDLVDSFGVNCHKKLLCPMEISALYVADRRPILAALSLQPEYLRNAASESGAVVDYQHWQMPLGRRFRALKLWFVFRRFGKEGIRAHLRRSVHNAAHFQSLLEKHGDLFEVAVPTTLSLVCFRLRGMSEEAHKEVLDNVKASGDCFIIHTKLEGQMVLRFACGGSDQSEKDIAGGFKVILREVLKVKAKLA